VSPSSTLTRALPGLLLLGVGCLGHERQAGAEGEPLYSVPPTIEAIRWECDATEARWRFELDALNWTANGDLWLAEGTDYVEKHALRSVEAARDGSWDALALELDIVPDWRDASTGSSTAFLCDPPTLEAISFRAVIYTPGGEEQADCASWGADPELFDRVEGAAACTRVWDWPDTGEDR
jgi:hypothetical protein